MSDRHGRRRDPPRPRRAARMLLPLAAALATVAAGATTPGDGLEQRAQRLAATLRCVVCQNETVAESPAPLAADLREVVRGQLRAGRSEAEVRDYLVARYGDFVLYDPPFAPRTWLLWLAPFAALAIGLAALLRTIARRSGEGEVP